MVISVILLFCNSILVKKGRQKFVFENYKEDIWLFDKFKCFNLLSFEKCSEKSKDPDILLSVKSMNSKLVIADMFLILYIKFYDKFSYFKYNNCDWKLFISVSLFCFKFRLKRFGRLTKLSIFYFWLFCKSRYLIFSSPSSNGIWVNFLLIK